MATGDRNKDGKPKDIVRHFSHEDSGEPICSTKNYGYSTKDISEVTCIKCKKKLPKDFKKYNILKNKLLAKYPGTSEVVSVENGIEVDRCKLENIFDVINPYNILTK